MPVTYDDCVFADRVLERSNTTGLDDFLCVGTRVGYRTFLDALDEDDVTVYLAEHETSGQWEIGKGTVGAAGLVSRDEIIDSSTGAKVDFSEGQKLVRCTLPAELIAQFAGFAIPFVDTQALVHDPADTTKLMRIDAGAVATGTTRVLSMPDKNVDLGAAILSDGTVAFAADQSMGGNQLTNVGAPTADDQATNKEYVDEAVTAGVVAAIAGSGDVSGSGASTDGQLFRADGTGGDALQVCPGWICDDIGRMVGKSYAHNVVTLTDGATVLMDWQAGNDFEFEITADRPLVFTNLKRGQWCTLLVIQGAGGSHNLGYSADVVWADAEAITWTTTAGRADLIGFRCHVQSGSPVIMAFILGQNLETT